MKGLVTYDVLGYGMQEGLLRIQKKGYLIKIGDNYFMAARDIHIPSGSQMDTWGIDEYYTGLKVTEGHRTRKAAIEYLLNYYRDPEKRYVLVDSITHVIQFAEKWDRYANLNPENYSYDITDLTHIADQKAGA